MPTGSIPHPTRHASQVIAVGAAGHQHRHERAAEPTRCRGESPSVWWLRERQLENRTAGRAVSALSAARMSSTIDRQVHQLVLLGCRSQENFETRRCSALDDGFERSH
jgi:hypothetical protein